MSHQGSVQRGIQQFPQTHIWVDSCAKDDLEYAISIGGVGATTNPVIVGKVLEDELPQWEAHIQELAVANDGTNEEDMAWQLIGEMGMRASNLLMPAFQANEGRCGRVSMQTNIKNYKNTEKMVAQAVSFHQMADNIQVKLPTTPQGVAAVEEVTFQGVNVNATVVFSVSQAIAVAEAVERGLARRRAAGLPCDQMTPVCTIMLGRIDDWLKTVAKNDNLDIDMEALDLAGVAVFKNAYKIFMERGYTTRLLTAAYRNIHHWADLLGGEVSMTIGRNYLEEFNAADVELGCTIETPIPQVHMDALMEMKEFRKAFDADGMTGEEVCHYGAFITCLEGFFEGYDKLLRLIRGYVIGKPHR